MVIDLPANSYIGFLGVAVIAAQVVLFSLLDVFKKYPRLFAMNQGPIVANAGAVDYQKIRTAEITFPVIRADVLTYQPGELGSSTTIGREGARVLYSEESLKDPEYLETLRRSPISIATHEKNTSEHNRDVDGWPVDAWFNENDKTVYVRGYVHGDANVTYVDQNKSKPGFGVSAYIEFIDVKRAQGVSSTGAEYDAVTTKLVNNHIAILPNIRDKKNVILALNALNSAKPGYSLEKSEFFLGSQLNYYSDKDGFMYVTADGKDVTRETSDKSRLKSDLDSWKKEEFKNYDKGWNSKNALQEQKTPGEVATVENNQSGNAGGKNMAEEKVDKEAVKSALNEIDKEKSKEEEYENLKNTVNSLSESFKNMEAKMAKNEDPKKDDDKDPKAENAPKDDEAANAANAMPSQDLVKDISEKYGLSFTKTPTIAQLGAVIGVTGKTLPETITALNAERTKIKSESGATALNSDGDKASLTGLMAQM